MTELSHDRYEELVAGHALSALEPEDEQLLLRHLSACATCEHDLVVHRETLAHLAYAADEGPPPAALWEGIREEVARSGADSFSRPGLLPPVADLRQARAHRLRRPSARRAAGWTAVAAAAALVTTLGVQNLGLQHDRDEQSAVSGRLAAAVRAVETGPARTVPLADKQGQVFAVAVLHADRLSLVVDGLAPNDVHSSTYVLWGASGHEPAEALATFDVRDDRLDVVHDVPLPAAEQPQLLLITRESGRTAPPVTQQPALATGRAV